MNTSGSTRTKPVHLALIASAVLPASLLTLGVSANWAQASVPGDNGAIAFVSDRDTAPQSDINDEIYVTDESGSPAVRLTNSLGLDTYPAVAPNGKEIAFVSDRNDETYPNPEGDTEIYVMDANDDDNDGNGDNLRRVTDNAVSELNLNWSPDGRTIAFHSLVEGDIDVYVLDADPQTPSEAPTNLTNNTSIFDGQPVFSPDGKTIAFNTNRDGNNNIYLMNADGSEPTALTNNPRADAAPEFSPDGKQLAFTSNRVALNDLDVYKMSAEPEATVPGADPDNVPVNLTNATGKNDRFPAWSPDGTKIAFWSGIGPGTGADSDIYVMEADDGSNPTAITGNCEPSPHCPSGEVLPDWGPARRQR